MVSISRTSSRARVLTPHLFLIIHSRSVDQNIALPMSGSLKLAAITTFIPPPYCSSSFLGRLSRDSGPGTTLLLQMRHLDVLSPIVAHSLWRLAHCAALRKSSVQTIAHSTQH